MGPSVPMTISAMPAQMVDAADIFSQLLETLPEPALMVTKPPPTDTMVRMSSPATPQLLPKKVPPRSFSEPPLLSPLSTWPESDHKFILNILLNFDKNTSLFFNAYNLPFY